MLRSPLSRYPLSDMRGFEAMNSGDRIGHRFSRELGVVVRLQVDPALCIGAEESKVCRNLSLLFASDIMGFLKYAPAQRPF